MRYIVKLHFLVCLTLLLGQAATDPEPLQDYCVANTNGPQTIHMNGPSCIDPKLTSPSHFSTSALSKPGNTSKSPSGFNIILTNISNLPGLNTQGLTMARVDISPDGLVPPHSHPRASEVTLCIKGELLVGFVDTSNRLYAQQLRPDESFVFPKGLIHFMYNLSPAHNAVAVSGLNSQNPGAQLMPVAAFASSPALPDEVLEKAFKIHGQDVARIRRNLLDG